MRVAVWNEFWSTLGGGEKYAGSIAEALRPHHDVELLGPDPIDVALL